MEQFLESLNRDLYLFYSGLKERLDISRHYSDYADLSSIETIRELTSEADLTAECFPSRSRSLARLRRYAIRHCLDASVSLLEEEISACEARASIEWEGRKYSLIQVPLLLAQEADAGRRRRLHALQIAARQEVESLRKEQLARLQNAAEELGFSCRLDAWQACNGVSYHNLSDEFEELLTETETVYLERMNSSLLATLGLSIHEAAHFDMGHWRRENAAWSCFSGERLLSTAQEVFANLGLRPQSAEAISWDLESRPLKQARPFCLPIRVPNEVKIALLPGGGYDDYTVLLHECGHAHHLAWTSPALPAEYRLCGDRGLSEAYAFLFEDLLMDGEWLRSVFGFTPPDNLLRFQRLYQAYLIRRYSGILQYEIALHGGSATGSAVSFAGYLRHSTGLEENEGFWLDDTTEAIYAADYLKGWACKSLLKDYLQSRYGSAWYRESKAGDCLKEIWETGLLYSADELCKELGLSPLDKQALQDELVEGLRH